MLISVPSISNLTPIIPRGSLISSRPSTMNCRGTTSINSRSGAIDTTCAASRTRKTSSFPISRSSFETATTRDVEVAVPGLH